MSTVAFLMLGVREANPLVRMVFSIGWNPIAGLLLAKVIPVSIAVYCWSRGRDRVLLSANLIFAFVVAWNLAIVILTVAQS